MQVTQETTIPTIIFRRTINKGFNPGGKIREDKVDKNGKLQVGSLGEHVQEWRCELQHKKTGAPKLAFSVSYFQQKVSQGYKPLAIEGVPRDSFGHPIFPRHWSDDEKERVAEALDYIAPMVGVHRELEAQRQENERLKQELEDERRKISGTTANGGSKTAGSGRNSQAV